MRVLMVSTEYPPMRGGIGRYTANLTRELRNLGFEVKVACNEMGDGDLRGLSPDDKGNSEFLMKVLDGFRPDLIHIQYEPAMYTPNSTDIKEISSYLDDFYAKCTIPIVTTLHAVIPFRQWINLALSVKRTGRIGLLGIPLRLIMRTRRCLLNYLIYKNSNRNKFEQSEAVIVFSKSMSKGFGSAKIVYIGAEPVVSPPPAKNDARNMFSLPRDKKILLVSGFMTSNKGWEILRGLDIPQGWLVVTNSAASHFNFEYQNVHFSNDKIIDLHKGFLSNEELSYLFYASDAVFLPYKVAAASGVMSEALAHGLPFIATDLEYFNEFASHGLGVTARRNSKAFSKAIRILDKNYDDYAQAVDLFKQKLKWKTISEQHASIYRSILTKESKMDR